MIVAMLALIPHKVACVEHDDRQRGQAAIGVELGEAPGRNARSCTSAAVVLRQGHQEGARSADRTPTLPGEHGNCPVTRCGASTRATLWGSVPPSNSRLATTAYLR